MIRVTTVAFALAALALLPAGVAAQAPSLKNPASLKEQAPATYKVKFDTSVGVFVIQVNRDWAPLGADRFYNLVKNGFYDDARFFRAHFRLHGAVRHQRRSRPCRRPGATPASASIR